MKINLTTLANGMRRLLRKLTHAHATRANRKKVKVEHSESGGNTNVKETKTCKICFTKAYVDQMFQVPNCLHRFCVPCMLKHVEYNLLHGILPKCPHVSCRTELQPDSYKGFLSPELVDIMSERVKEAFIPVEDRIYCPNPMCSALFSKPELKGYEWSSSNARKRSKCRGIFCIECKVQWHDNMTCMEYKTENPYTSREERELHCMATRELWRQCPKCSNMVSLVGGCYHVYCRCEAKWRSGPPCRCPNLD